MTDRITHPCPICGQHARIQYGILTCSHCHRGFPLTPDALPSRFSAPVASSSRAPSAINRPHGPADGAKLFCPNCFSDNFNSEEELVNHLCNDCPEKARYNRDNASVTAYCVKLICEKEGMRII